MAVPTAVRQTDVAHAGVELMLSGRCNLACAYCYQDRRRVRASIGWGSVRAALDAVLRLGTDEFGVEFSGGEPLLEPGLLRRAVDYVERRRGGRKVSYTLTTNGTLLTRALLDFLVEHDFRIRLSFDGIAAAQDLRSPGTFAVLDRLLDLLRQEYPTYFHDRVNVGVTLRASAIPHLAESVRYFIAKGVADVGIAPHSTWEPDWHAGRRDELQAQVDEILELSLEHWHRTGLVPVEFLAGAPLRNAEGPVGDFLCGAVYGEAMAVDPDGRAWACPMFATSLRNLPRLAADASHVLDLGDVSDRRLARRMRRLPARAYALRVFTNKCAKHSSYVACSECRFVAHCHVCAASICYIPGNEDPDRVPDFICAFNRVTLEARQRFDERTGRQASVAWFGEVRQALRELGEAIQAASGERHSGERRAGRAAPSRRPARRHAPGLTRRATSRT
jgi:sulfatase maturation enzyme AslB (radical SAM superfamily)